MKRSDRKHESDREPDQRNSFQRDRDRLLYSLPFRQLAGVTQVVHAAEGHIFHNRLTHTIKVAQIGRRITEHLLDRYKAEQELIQGVGGLDADVVETAALAHDLGHPPFGHIAESELDHQLRQKNMNDGFEGNPQSFRIVTKFGRRLGEIPGLNLTRASLNALLKYPWQRSKNGKKSRKWGHYKTEVEDFKFARGSASGGDFRRSAEAELMDWADDVAYSVHDVEDFYRAGLIPLDQILSGGKERDNFIQRCFGRWDEENDKPKFPGISPAWASSFFENLKYYAQKHDLVEPFSATLSQLAGLDLLTALLIKRFILGASEKEPAIVLNNKEGQDRVIIEPQIKAEVELLKKLMSIYVFENPALVAQQYGQRRVIKELFEALYEAANPLSKNRGIIPDPFRGALNALGMSDDQERARIVADLIASMTEQQALLFHQRLMGLHPGSVRDLIIR